MLLAAIGVVGLLGVSWGPPAVEVLELSDGRRGTVFSLPTINSRGEVAYLSDDRDDAALPEVRFAPAPGAGGPFTVASEATGVSPFDVRIEDPDTVFLNDTPELVFQGTSPVNGIAVRTYLGVTPTGTIRDATPVTVGVPRDRSLNGRGTINSFGTVAFGQQGEGSPLEVGVFKFRTDRLLVPFAVIEDANAPFFFVSDFPTQLLDDGRVLFQAFKPQGGVPRPSLVLAGPGPGVFEELVDGTEFGETLLTYASASLGGEIAYAVTDSFSGVQELRRWNAGQPEVVVRAGGPPAGGCAVDGFAADYERGGFAINDLGQIAFLAEVQGQPTGLYFEGCAESAILRVGDRLDQFEFLGPIRAIDLGPRSLNAAGQLAVRVEFDGGRDSALLRIALGTGPQGCPADLNQDGFLDQGDISAFVDRFLFGDPSADLNGDGFLDTGDITTFVQLFLDGC